MSVNPGGGGFTPLLELPKVAYSSSSLPTSPGAHNAIVLVVSLLLMAWGVAVGMRAVKALSILKHLQPTVSASSEDGAFSDASSDVSDITEDAPSQHHNKEPNVLTVPRMSVYAKDFDAITRKHVAQILQASRELRKPPVPVPSVNVCSTLTSVSYIGGKLTVNTSAPCKVHIGTGISAVTLDALLNPTSHTGSTGPIGAAERRAANRHWWIGIMKEALKPTPLPTDDARHIRWSRIPPDAGVMPTMAEPLAPASRARSEDDCRLELSARMTNVSERLPFPNSAPHLLHALEGLCSLTIDSGTSVDLIIPPVADDVFPLMLLLSDPSRPGWVLALCANQTVLGELVVTDDGALHCLTLFGLRPEDDSTCMICYDNVRSVALLPCGHCCLCYRCARHLRDQKCPMCRTVFDAYVTIPVRFQLSWVLSKLGSESAPVLKDRDSSVASPPSTSPLLATRTDPKELPLPVLLDTSSSSSATIGDESLRQAVESGDLKRVATIVSSAATDINRFFDRFSYRHTALFIATKLGKIDIMRILLDAGADPNLVCTNTQIYERDTLDFHETALYHALRNNKLEAARVLLEYPITDVNVLCRHEYVRGEEEWGEDIESMSFRALDVIPIGLEGEKIAAEIRHRGGLKATE
ncbi:hypothetical protein FOL47_003176 [Perkinsus chesapeaki]|uniref:RING-type domain-containing protein n=1 Tax=Perkinsus chesapeaki TaxID=330153 RepID=A0A7J6M968_PERCH|nr:hypothetical protein FOL47_003176 [Perkinsus chesapeaki]